MWISTLASSSALDELTGERSNRAVLDLALRRLIAAKQKGAMIDAIAELADLPEGLDAPALPPESAS